MLNVSYTYVFNTALSSVNINTECRSKVYITQSVKIYPKSKSIASSHK